MTTTLEIAQQSGQTTVWTTQSALNSRQRWRFISSPCYGADPGGTLTGHNAHYC